MATVYVNENGVAINGYDPVAYFEGSPQAGRADITSAYNGATYYFTSEDHKARFEAAPEQFAPAYGGFCATAMADGHEVPTNPETYKITDGRLYLFYNGKDGNTLPVWEANEAELRARSDAQWAQKSR
ncbi:MAG: hypothetical protein OHK0046_52210 [Anaerolineae bacterium]